jgi:Secretion system C-terminal sorting domain
MIRVLPGIYNQPNVALALFIYLPVKSKLMKKIILITLLLCFVSVVFAQTPSLSAGKDQSIFAGQAAFLKGKAINVAKHLWVTSGSGTFDNPKLLKTYYHPSAADIANGNVRLTLKSTRGPLVKDEMKLTILSRPCPAVFMPGTDTICASSNGGEYYLDKAVITGNDYSVLWTTSGGNFEDYIANETSATDAYFVYGAGTGQSGQVITFTITVTDNLGICDPVSSSISVKFNDRARMDNFYVNGMSANEGSIIICDFNPVLLSADVSGTAYMASFSAGSGVMERTSNTSATYYPTLDDVANGYIGFFAYTNDPAGPCGPASAFADGYFQFSIPDAGPDIEACADINGGSIPINANLTGSGGSFYWATNGTGYFDDMYSLQTNYHYSYDDVNNGAVEIYAIADGCGQSYKDTVNISLLPSGSLAAGDDITVCGYNGGSVQLNASVSPGNLSFNWSTSGSGWFDDASNPNTNYYYSLQDVNNTNITITASLDGTCSGSFTDDLNLTLQEAASVYMPNQYATACSSAPDISAEAYTYGYAGPGEWSTSGSGYFDDIHSGYTTYHGSQGDIDAGCVDLTFTVQGGGNCGGASNYMTACFYDCASNSIITKSLKRNKTEVLLYPNPASDVLYLKTNSPINKNQFYITDITGRVMRCKWISKNCLDIKTLSPGIYLLRTANSSIKFIKQ